MRRLPPYAPKTPIADAIIRGALESRKENKEHRTMGGGQDLAAEWRELDREDFLKDLQAARDRRAAHIKALAEYRAESSPYYVEPLARRTEREKLTGWNSQLNYDAEFLADYGEIVVTEIRDLCRNHAHPGCEPGKHWLACEVLKIIERRN